MWLLKTGLCKTYYVWQSAELRTRKSLRQRMSSFLSGAISALRGQTTGIKTTHKPPSVAFRGGNSELGSRWRRWLHVAFNCTFFLFNDVGMAFTKLLQTWLIPFLQLVQVWEVRSDGILKWCTFSTPTRWLEDKSNITYGQYDLSKTKLLFLTL